MSVCTCSTPTPAGPRTPDHYSAATWPLVLERQRLPRKVFRRSIAWLSDSLFTLRSAGCPAPRKTRFRPLVRRYRTGFPPARFQRKVSDMLPTCLPPFPRFLGAICKTGAVNARTGESIGWTCPIYSQSDGVAIAGLLRGNRFPRDSGLRGRPAVARVAHTHEVAGLISAPESARLLPEPRPP